MTEADGWGARVPPEVITRWVGPIPPGPPVERVEDGTWAHPGGPAPAWGGYSPVRMDGGRPVWSPAPYTDEPGAWRAHCSDTPLRRDERGWWVGCPARPTGRVHSILADAPQGAVLEGVLPEEGPSSDTAPASVASAEAPVVTATVTATGSACTASVNRGAVEARVYAGGDHLCMVVANPDPLRPGRLVPWGDDREKWAEEEHRWCSAPAAARALLGDGWIDIIIAAVEAAVRDLHEAPAATLARIGVRVKRSRPPQSADWIEVDVTVDGENVCVVHAFRTLARGELHVWTPVGAPDQWCSRPIAARAALGPDWIRLIQAALTRDLGEY